MIYKPSEDSYLLEKEVKKLSKGKNVLDIGAGSGIQARAALESSAKNVIASDIDKEAVKLLNKQGIKAIRSNLFSNIKGKFGLIIFNPPYLPRDKREDKESSLITSGGKKGDEIILRFLKNVKPHLNKNGIILLVVSSLTPKKRILPLLNHLKLKKKVLSTENFFMEVLEVWKIQIL